MKNPFDFDSVDINAPAASAGDFSFDAVKIEDPRPPVVVGTPDASAKFDAKMADQKERERIVRFAADLGTTPDDPVVRQRLTNPPNFSTTATLMKLAENGNPDEANTMTPEGNAAGLGLKPR